MATWPRSAGTVPLSIIQDRRFTRQEFDGTFDELLKSISTNGIIVPVVVNATYEVVDGMRRVQAARVLGHTQVPCIATNNYRTVAAHLMETRRFTESEGLPALAYAPRGLAEHVDMLSELHRSTTLDPRMTKISQRRPNVPIIAIAQFNADMLEIFGWSKSHYVCTRTIFALERAMRNRSDPEAVAVVEFVARWEAQWPDTLTPSSAKTRLYTLARRAKAPSSEPAEPIPVKVTMAVTRHQQAAFNDTLARVAGAVSGLLAIDQLSPHLAKEDLVRWERELEAINRNIRTVRHSIRSTQAQRAAANSEESAS